MPKMIFVNLPVSDLARSTAFYQALGAEKNPLFSDDTALMIVFSETIHAMLLTHDKFRRFTTKRIADARETSEVLICLSADSREDVDAMVDTARAAGGGLETLEPLGQHVGADSGQAAANVVKSFRAEHKLADDEQGPALADQIERMGGSAGVLVAAAHRVGYFL